MSLRPRRLSWNSLGVAVLALAVTHCGLAKEFTEPSTLSIQKFVASPSDIPAGSPTTLTWDVAGADTIEIDNGVGTVTARGTRDIKPQWTTSFNLIARAGSSQATATVQVRVAPGTVPSPSPSPAASPTPSPSPSASPSPSPLPSPSPSPTPTPSPSPTPSDSPSPAPSPTPTPVTCGAPATTAGNCSVTVTHAAFASNECIQVNAVTVNQSCPVGIATARSVRFDVTAHTTRTLRWRRSPSSSDVVDPAGGTIGGSGTTSVLVTDVVLDSTVTIEIVDGSTVLAAFTLRHY
jgi:hypothetical protein